MFAYVSEYNFVKNNSLLLKYFVRPSICYGPLEHSWKNSQNQLEKKNVLQEEINFYKLYFTKWFNKECG